MKTPNTVQSSSSTDHSLQLELSSEWNRVRRQSISMDRPELRCLSLWSTGLRTFYFITMQTAMVCFCDQLLKGDADPRGGSSSRGRLGPLFRSTRNHFCEHDEPNLSVFSCHCEDVASGDEIEPRSLTMMRITLPGFSLPAIVAWWFEPWTFEPKTRLWISIVSLVS